MKIKDLDHFTLISIATIKEKKKENISIGESVEKSEPRALLESTGNNAAPT